MVKRLILVVVLFFVSLVMGGLAHADLIAKSPLTSVGAQLGETSIGDLVADAIRDSVHAPIGLLAAGSLREVTIPKGKADASDIRQCIQYPDDKIVVMELTGAEIRQALERSVSIYPQKNLGFLQVSGIRVVIRPENAKGNRIASLAMDSGPFSDDAKYQVATTVPVANGAYGYFTIWDKAEIAKAKTITISQALTDFLAASPSFDYSQADRIVVKK
jgi:2',3'-cyclic-nucleotide 2'-phosphodiesterase (5'-nucleotidase family)